MSFQKGHKLNLGNQYRKGKIPWNKGSSGICKPNNGSFKKGERISPKTEFKKGLKPWNKGLKGFLSGESHPFFGKKLSLEHRKKLSNAKKGILGEKHWNWKGGYHKSSRRIFDMNSKGSFTKDQWLEMKIKYNYMCLCCKLYEPEIKLTADHIVPITKWEEFISINSHIKYKCGDIENIQPLCMECNQKKFTKIIDYRLFSGLIQNYVQ